MNSGNQLNCFCVATVLSGGRLSQFFPNSIGWIGFVCRLRSLPIPLNTKYNNHKSAYSAKMVPAVIEKIQINWLAPNKNIEKRKRKKKKTNELNTPKPINYFYYFFVCRFVCWFYIDWGKAERHALTTVLSISHRSQHIPHGAQFTFFSVSSCHRIADPGIGMCGERRYVSPLYGKIAAHHSIVAILFELYVEYTFHSFYSRDDGGDAEKSIARARRGAHTGIFSLGLM